ncbi:TPA: LamG domain-containing protein [Candidatus Poribacteria bacterium]|nr:LamG domain-containing protein [Candidatus Poribacteria bacterium]
MIYLSFGNTKTTLKPNKWYHLALTFDGNDTRIYVDGQRKGKSSRKGPITVNNSDLMVEAEPSGVKLDPEWPAWHGCLDEFYLYNRVLSKEEVEQLIKIGLDVQPKGKLTAC